MDESNEKIIYRCYNNVWLSKFIGFLLIFLSILIISLALIPGTNFRGSELISRLLYLVVGPIVLLVAILELYVAFKRKPIIFYQNDLEIPDGFFSDKRKKIDYKDIIEILPNDYKNKSLGIPGIAAICLITKYNERILLEKGELGKRGKHLLFDIAKKNRIYINKDEISGRRVRYILPPNKVVYRKDTLELVLPYRKYEFRWKEISNVDRGNIYLTDGRTFPFLAFSNNRGYHKKIQKEIKSRIEE
ncbi:MAG: hypothetical protein JSW00_04360 [Thermoplasmata archaeon]|nr:MAG: hypothetical protein JSW00_04360 [Thermoplasmata archaeon]